MSPAYEFSYMMEDGLGVILSGLASSIPSGLLSIVSYVLTSLALYTLAQRRGINKPWLSWIPVVNVWVLGSLSDQYRYVVRGENKSKRKVLLILNLISAILSGVVLVMVLGAVVELIGGAIYGMSQAALMESVMGLVVSVVGVSLPMVGVAIAKAVVYFMALYDVYTSMDPGNNVLFLVLSILFGIIKPFFLFFNRNKDLGMPPRRQEPQWQEPEQPQWQPQDPWENADNKDYL